MTATCFLTFLPLSLPVHVSPSPLNPVLHAQVKLPKVLVQSALSSQLSVPSVHSSISAGDQKIKIKDDS